MGGTGVTLALDIIRKELEVSMALAGRTDVQRIDRNVLVP
jgi:L-lactate dehydrogenase (cytochrome)